MMIPTEPVITVPVIVLLRVAIPIADRRTGRIQRMTSADSDPTRDGCSLCPVLA